MRTHDPLSNAPPMRMLLRAAKQGYLWPQPSEGHKSLLKGLAPCWEYGWWRHSTVRHQYEMKFVTLMVWQG